VWLGSCKRGEVWQAACLPGEQPVGEGEVVPQRPLCASALERRAGSCFVRFVLTRCGEKDIGPRGLIWGT
jgi:hypothetical protein